MPSISPFKPLAKEDSESVPSVRQLVLVALTALLMLCSTALTAQELSPLPRAGTVQGQAWERHSVDDSSKGADGVRLLDANRDDLLDIATPWEEGGVVRVYLHPDAERVIAPWPAVTAGSVASPEDAVLFDLDEDGAADVIGSTEGEDRKVYVHWAPKDPKQYLTPSAWHTAALPASLSRQWMFLVPVQIDGVNGADLVAAGKNDGAAIGWFLAPADPRQTDLWIWVPQYPVGWVMSIRLIDMDKDNDFDIVYSDRKGNDRGVWWLENPGFAEADKHWDRHQIGGGGREVMFLNTGDLDNDGDLDLALATRDGGILYLTRMPGTGQWRQREIPMPLDSGTGKAVAIGDVDKNGRSDFVVSCEAAAGKHGVFRLSQTLPHTWEAFAISGLEGTKFDLVELVDIDGDGDLDVLTCEENENLGVIWYENPRH